MNNGRSLQLAFLVYARIIYSFSRAKFEMSEPRNLLVSGLYLTESLPLPVLTDLNNFKPKLIKFGSTEFGKFSTTKAAKFFLAAFVIWKIIWPVIV
jgi:hypothetical protein